jgi:hypothetical protein
MQDNYDDETERTAAAENAGADVPAAPPGMKPVNPFVLFRQQNSAGGFFKGDLLKMDHNTGAVLRERGSNKTVIDPGERFTVNPNEMIDTWSKFIDGKLIERRVYRTADGEMAPEREELGDTEENAWPLDKAGKKRKDPWSRMVYLPMKGADGEVVAFKATGGSAIGEIGELVGMYGSADRHGRLPVVVIETRNFESQHGNTIHVPVFRLVDWGLWDDQPTPMAKPVLVPIAPSAKPTTDKLAARARKRAVGGDLDDDIPF